ncbi:MAG: heparinase II/III-family protein [candidate division KSB1 bacterium]|nr:heparinase II/III-family protein [candidate division KSB1 bacterium]
MGAKNYLFGFTMIIVVLLMLSEVAAQNRRSLLQQSLSATSLDQILVGRETWRPYPKWAERQAWLSLPAPLQRELVQRGESFLQYSWPALPAVLFLEFARKGNRENFQNAQFERRTALINLVLAECIEGRGRFLDDIINGIWIICEESFWGVPAHLGMQKRGVGLPDVTEPVVDLFVNETGALLAWTHYLLKQPLDDASPLICQRIEVEVDKRILKPCLERNDFWWMSFRPMVTINNWNPWNNSNWLTSVLLLEQDAGRRAAAVNKIMQSLDRFIDSYPDDGGCDEGPGYWNRAAGSLFDCLELLHSATNGAVDIYSQPLIQEMGRYIYRAHIGGRHFINFADAPAIATIESDLVHRYGQRIGDASMMGFAAYIDSLQHQNGRSFEGSIGRQLAAIFNFTSFSATRPQAPLPRDVWLPGNQVMVARDAAGTSVGFFVAAQGGHNDESHNHNDVGNFIVYLDGKPLVIDVGVETYTRKTFSAQRYDIWTMQSAYHNLPTVNGIMQQEGRNFAARDVQYATDDDHAQLRLDIAGAYPETAGINRWIRTIRLNRQQEIELTDAFELQQATSQIELTLMTPCQVSVDPPGRLNLKRGNDPTAIEAHVVYDETKLTPAIETIAINDANLRKNWGHRIYRVLLKSTVARKRDTWKLRITR